ncbi:hypothetical protein FACS189431_4900 [Alphaproteobacteria bacterium]|nr:hypothetical protein FACS189431_4900 [Alphaproteobacteria bacterium]
MITLHVSPVSQNIELAPNVRTDLTVNVTNAGTENVSFRAYAEKYPLGEADSETQWTVSPYSLLCKWFNFDQTEYHDVAPEQSVQVTAHITAPHNVAVGQQQAVIFIESLPTGSSGTSIEAVGRVGSIVTADIKASPKPEIPVLPMTVALAAIIIVIIVVIVRKKS